MTHFSEIKYERIDFDKTKTDLEILITLLKDTDNADVYISTVKNINDLQCHIEEMFDYADIRNMRDLNDKHFKEEIEYWNSLKPKFDLLFLPYYEEIKNSKFKKKLSKIMPNNFFKIIEFQARITSDKNIELLKREKELKVRYMNLNNTKVLYDETEMTIGTISSLFVNRDRKTRKKAHDAVNDFYYEHRREYTELLYELVNVRNKIAKNLGFNNYVEYSLYLHKRIGYDYDDIAKFRNNVIEFIVPLCKKISEWQKEELKLTKLEYFDTVFFAEMPKIKLFGKDLLHQLKKSFAEVDVDLSNLYDDMVENGYIDLIQKDGKINFAITNYLTETKMPVITGNFKNIYLDVQVSTHEMGHSYQKYCASKKDEKYVVSPLLKYPTMEIAEMFSYSMELIMIGHIENIFEKTDYRKYCFMKIYNLVAQLPYMCLIDEFQQVIYSKENLEASDIKRIWLELASIYHLEKNNSGHINLDDGGFFYRQSHIYLNPFYYIDYALSYFGAFAIWNNCENDIELFKEIGGVASYYSFKDLIDKYNMPNPFSRDVLKDISLKLYDELKTKRITTEEDVISG